MNEKSVVSRKENEGQLREVKAFKQKKITREGVRDNAISSDKWKSLIKKVVKAGKGKMSLSFYSAVSNLSKIPTTTSFNCRKYIRHNKSTDQILVSLYNELDLSGELPVYCDKSLISEYQ